MKKGVFKPTFSIFIKKTENKDGKYTVSLVVYYKSRGNRYSLFEAEKKDILYPGTEKRRLKPNTKLERDAYNLIDSLNKEAKKIPPEVFVGMTHDEIRCFVMKKIEVLPSDPKDFRLDFLKYGFRYAKTKKTPATINTYKYALRALERFIQRDYLDINEVTSSFLKRFEQSLIGKLGKTSTVKTYLCMIETIHKSARLEFNCPERNYLPIVDPFPYFKPERYTPHRKEKAVSRELIQHLIDNRNSFVGPVQKATDLFLLTFCLQGMNLADMMSAKRPENGILDFNRMKTKDRRADNAETKIRIPDCIKPLYDLYKDPQGENAFVFNRTCKKLNCMHSKTHKWMKALKEHLKTTEFASDIENLSLYSARHSYATVSRALGIDKWIISDGLSHVDKSMATTDIYIKKEWMPIWDANDKMLASFNWDALTKSPLSLPKRSPRRKAKKL